MEPQSLLYPENAKVNFLSKEATIGGFWYLDLDYELDYFPHFT